MYIYSVYPDVYFMTKALNTNSIIVCYYVPARNICLHEPYDYIYILILTVSVIILPGRDQISNGRNLFRKSI